MTHRPKDLKGHTLFYMESAEDSDNEEDGKEEEGEDFRTEMKNGYKIVSNVNRCIFTGNTVLIGGVYDYPLN